MTFRSFSIALLLAGVSATAQAADISLLSPNRQVEVRIGTSEQRQPTYAVFFQGKPVIAPSPLGLDLDRGGRLSYGLAITGSKGDAADKNYTLVAGKTGTARDHYNEMVVDLAEPKEDGRKLQLIFRAYDDGAAFRYRVPVQPGTEAASILGEMTRFDFPQDYQCWGLNLGKFRTSHEGEFDPVRASLMREHNLFDAPFVCKTGDGTASFAIAEADLKNYAGMYLTGRGDGGLGAQVKLSPRLDDPNVAVKTRIGSDIYSPWRVVMLAEEPGKLIESNLITSLNPEPAFDTSWIKPGKSAWDWWNGPTLDGKAVPMNNETYRRFIDFAAANKLEYMMIDEGWYAGAGGGGTVRPGVDVTRSIPEIDLPALVEYGRKRNVGLWLWLNWKALDAQMDEALALYERLGIKGIKVDFMDRDDQEMVDWYHRLLQKAAKHKLLVNLHGAYHPTGLARTYPNYLTQEGVLGAEYNKWSRRITARHNVTLPYTRMLTGPMDYTPGGFRNVSPEAFRIQNAPPFVQTTRGHGLAMYVVYDSPLGLVSDTPDASRNEPGLDFISMVPTTWDETRFIAGDIGEYVVLARRKGRDWYVGAMTNESGRTIELPLDFLGSGRFAATSWADGKEPDDLKIERWEVPATSRRPVRLELAPTGGAALRFTPRR